MPGARGEGFIEFEGELKPVLFTNRALAQIEQVTGRSAVQLIQQGGITVGATAQMLAIGLEFGRKDAREARRSYTVDDAWQIMDTLGWPQVLKVVTLAVANVLAYTRETEDSSPPA